MNERAFVSLLEFSRACLFRAFQAFGLLRILSGFSGRASGFSIVVKYANLKLRMQSNFPHQTRVDTYEMTYYFFLLARKYEFRMILVKSSLQYVMKSELLIDMEKLVSLLEISFVTRGDIPFWDISKPKID